MKRAMQLITTMRGGLQQVSEYIGAKLLARPIVMRLMIAALVGCTSEGFADGGGAIPTPSDDTNPTNGSDFVDIVGHLIRKGCVILLYGTAIFFVCFAAYEIYRGYTQYREKDDMGKLKASLIVAGILLATGAAALFFGQYVLNHWTVGK
mgnify:CR=1 FL=1